jgi:hypothetical protein
MCVGLLWHFRADGNRAPRSSADHRATVTKYIAPTVLFWFRHAVPRLVEASADKKAAAVRSPG